MRTENQKKKREEFKNILKKCNLGILLALGFSFVTTTAMLIPPIYMINLFNSFSHSGSIGTLIGLSAMAVGGIVLYGIFEFLRTQVYQALGGWLGSRLSEEAMEPIVQQSIRGRISASEILRDIGEIRNFVAGSALTAGLEFFWSPIFFLALFVLHPFFGWLGVIGGILILMLAIANELLTRYLVTEVSDKSVASYNEIGHALRNGEAIEAMGILGNVLKRWNKRNDELLEVGRKSATRQSAISSISRALRLMIQMAIFGGGMIFVLKQELSFGSLIAGSIILGRALAPVEALIDGWRSWVSSGAAMKRVLLVLEDHASFERSTTPLPRPSTALVVERVVFVPPGSAHTVLRGVNLTVNAGEIVCLIGSSAAGKSTLARLIVGIWPPNAGSIRLDGHDVHTWNRADFGRHVGYLPQTVELFNGTIRDNIARLSDHDPEDVIEAAKKVGIHSMIGAFPNGYDTRVGDGGHNLTGGQRLRIGVARALYGNPALLVLDEPDASLDAESLIALTETLRVMKEAGSIVVVITHRAQMLRCADRIVVLENGMVSRVLTPDEFDQAGGGTMASPISLAKPT